MSDVKSLKDFRTEIDAYDEDTLRLSYEEAFGSAPVSTDGAPTNDLVGIKKKLTYAYYVKQFSDRNLEVPSKVATAAKEIFDAPFKEKKAKAAKKEPRYTIQMFITDLLWDLMQRGEHKTIEELGDAVVQKYPSSTYSKDPVGRMRIDIRKFNSGQFECQKAMGKVPSDESQHFKPTPSPATERKPREKKEPTA